MHRNLLSVIAALALIASASLPARARAQVNEASRSWRDTAFTVVSHDGTLLEAKLSLPARTDSIVGVVFYLHGAGPRAVDHVVRFRDASGTVRAVDYYGYVARELTARGIAFFRIAKRGCTLGPDGRTIADRRVFSQATPSVLLEDYGAALAALRTRTDVDPTRIVLYGSSEGTRLAAQLSLRAPSGVRGLVLTSHMSDNLKNTVIWQNSEGPWRNVAMLIPAAKGGSLGRAAYDSALASNPALSVTFPFASLDANRDSFVTKDELGQLLKGRLDAILAAVESRNDEFLWTSLLNLSSAYLRDGWEAEPTSEYLLRLRVPIRIFHGAMDATTRVEGVLETERAFRAAGRDNLRVRIYPDLGHDLGWDPAASDSRGSAAMRDSFDAVRDLLRGGAPRPERRSPLASRAR